MASQKVKTIEYWDNFYDKVQVNQGTSGDPSTSSKKSSQLEWILPNSRELLDAILSLFPKRDEIDEYCCNHDVLEIGCGVSQLSISLLQRLNNEDTDTASHKHKQEVYNFTSTDVSSVCIEHNRIRDDAFITSLQYTDYSLSYEIFDVLAGSILTSQHYHKYEVIFDKGTLDTFLFRTKRTKKGSLSHPPLLTILLNNIHRLLRSGGGSYVIISPRQRIKSVRDFKGFASVSRMTVDVDGGGGAVLVKGNAKQQSKKSDVYLYKCTKNDHYNPDTDKPFAVSDGEEVNDESTCETCSLTFKEFRGNIRVNDQGEVVWVRRWKNHIVHCHGNK